MEYITKLFQLVESNRSMALLAVFGAAFAIYSTFYYEKRPELTIRTDSISRVFDLYKPVGNLKILYADQDLRSSKKQLWAMNVSVINSGGTDIRKTDFDDAAPFGLLFSNAEIVDTPSLITSDSYLKEHIEMKVVPNKILLSPTMLDTKDNFEISLLLLSPEALVPSVNGIGKIAGIKQFRIESKDTKTSSKTWWEMLTESDALWVQFVRPFVYGIGGLVVLALSITIVILASQPFTRIAEEQRKRMRRNKISNFNPHKELSREARVLSELYVSHGDHGLKQAWKAINMIKHRLEIAQQLKVVKDESLYWSILFKMTPIKKTAWIFDELSKGGLIQIEDELPQLSTSLESSLIELANYVGVTLKEDKYSININEFMNDHLSENNIN